MNERTADAVVYVPLLFVMALYALLLDRNKQRTKPGAFRLEPDWTWVEIIGGVLLCLGAAYARSRLGPDTRADALRAVWGAVIVSLAPIISWQIWRASARRRQREKTLRYYEHEESHDKQRTPTRLAPARRPGAKANGRDR